MDYSLIIGLVLVAIAITYGITAWAHRKNAPAIIVTAANDIRATEQKVEADAKAVEPAIKAEVGKIVVNAEDTAWAALQASIAKVTDLSAEKQALADAQAALVAKQKRLADMKSSVAALPQA